jgi:hypothetical protein
VGYFQSWDRVTPRTRILRPPSLFTNNHHVNFVNAAFPGTMANDMLYPLPTPSQHIKQRLMTSTITLFVGFGAADLTGIILANF